MKRNEVLSLLERFPELVDGDDDLLQELIVEAGPELPETEVEPTAAHPKSAADSHEWSATRPR